MELRRNFEAEEAKQKKVNLELLNELYSVRNMLQAERQLRQVREAEYADMRLNAQV